MFPNKIFQKKVLYVLLPFVLLSTGMLYFFSYELGLSDYKLSKNVSSQYSKTYKKTQRNEGLSVINTSESCFLLLESQMKTLHLKEASKKDSSCGNPLLLDSFVIYKGVAEYNKYTAGPTRDTGNLYYFDTERKVNKQFFFSKSGPIKLVAIDTKNKNIVILTNKLFVYQQTNNSIVLNEELAISKLEFPEPRSVIDVESWLVGKVLSGDIKTSDEIVTLSYKEGKNFEFILKYNRNEKLVKYDVVDLKN